METTDTGQPWPDPPIGDSSWPDPAVEGEGESLTPETDKELANFIASTTAPPPPPRPSVKQQPGYRAAPGEMAGQSWIDWWKHREPAAKQALTHPESTVDRGTQDRLANIFTSQAIVPPQVSPMYWYGKGLEAVAPRMPASLQAVTRATAGLYTGGAKTISQFTTPMNVGLALAPGGIEAAVGRQATRALGGIISGVFFGQAIKGTPEQWKAIKEAYDNGDWQAVTEHATMMGASYLPAIGMFEAARGWRPTPVKPPPVPEQYMRPPGQVTPETARYTQPGEAGFTTRPTKSSFYPEVPLRGDEEKMEARPQAREPSPAEAAGQPTMTSAELIQQAGVRLGELESKEILNPVELNERDFLRKTDDPEEIAARFGVVLSDTGGETDASGIAKTEGVVLRGEGGEVVPETSLRQSGEAAQIQEQPRPTGQPVAAEAPPEDVPPGVRPFLPQLKALRDQGLSRDEILDAYTNRQRQKGFSPQQISQQLREVRPVVEQLVPEEIAPTQPGPAAVSGTEIPPAAEPPAADKAIRELEEKIRRERDPEKLKAMRQQLDELQAPPPTEPVLVTGKKRSFKVRASHDEFGSEMTPVASYVMENGGILSKSEAAKQGKLAGNESQWDDPPLLKHPTHNKIYQPGGEMPDVMAQHLADEGLIPEGDTQAMNRALEKESTSVRTGRKARASELVEAKGVEGAIQQAEEFGKAQRAEKEAGKTAIQVRDLAEGDKVTVDDQEIKVTGVDPEGVVTLEDGKRFGIQEVTDNDVIYGEIEPKAEDLELAPPESVEEQAARTAREAEQKAASEALKEKKAQVKYGWAQKKTGTTGDLGQLDIEGVEAPPQEELFSQGKKIKLKADKEGGFVNPEVMRDAIDFGRRLYTKGMDFARWSGQMLQHLGEGIKEFLGHIWASITGKNILPHARQRGVVAIPGGKSKLPAWRPVPDTTSMSGSTDYGAGSAHGIARVYIEDAIKRGDLPETALAIGMGKTPGQVQAQGIDFINKGGSVAQIVADLKKGIFHVDVTMPAIWAERQRLGVEREQAQLAALRRPGDSAAQAAASAAEGAELNFLRTVRPLAGGATQQIMVGWQEAKPLSLLTFDGLYRKAIELNGHNELTTEQRIDLARRATDGLKVKARETESVNVVAKEANKTMPRKRPPTKEEMKNIIDNLKNKLPCP